MWQHDELVIKYSVRNVKLKTVGNDATFCYTFHVSLQGVQYKQRSLTF
jgi:hypothetical protein